VNGHTHTVRAGLEVEVVQRILAAYAKSSCFLKLHSRDFKSQAVQGGLLLPISDGRLKEFCLLGTMIALLVRYLASMLEILSPLVMQVALHNGSLDTISEECLLRKHDPETYQLLQQWHMLGHTGDLNAIPEIAQHMSIYDDTEVSHSVDTNMLSVYHCPTKGHGIFNMLSRVSPC
jgi:hypothetical protein